VRVVLDVVADSDDSAAEFIDALLADDDSSLGRLLDAHGCYYVRRADMSDARDALLFLDRAAEGCSNDTEISAGRDVADILADLAGYETPDDLEELDDDEEVRF
jgi:hypothetical protein